MTTDSKMLGQVISDVQSDAKRAISALAFSLHSAGHLDPKVLRETTENMLDGLLDRSNQNSGILEHLRKTAQALESGAAPKP